MGSGARLNAEQAVAGGLGNGGGGLHSRSALGHGDALVGRGEGRQVGQQEGKGAQTSVGLGNKIGPRTG